MCLINFHFKLWFKKNIYSVSVFKIFFYVIAQVSWNQNLFCEKKLTIFCPKLGPSGKSRAPNGKGWRYQEVWRLRWQGRIIRTIRAWVQFQAEARRSETYLFLFLGSLLWSLRDLPLSICKILCYRMHVAIYNHRQSFFLNNAVSNFEKFI